MSNQYSLAFLTTPELSPLEAVQVAFEAGYQKVGFRLLPAISIEGSYPLLSDKKLAKQVKRQLDDHGMSIGDVELIWLKPDTQIEAYQSFFEQVAMLGGQHVIVLSDDKEYGRTIDYLGRLSEIAASYGAHLSLEAIPWTSLNRLETAIDIVQSVAQTNCHLLIDALHFFRMASDLSMLQHLPAETIKIFQVCDAPLSLNTEMYPDFRHEAKFGRLFPGDGELNLKALHQALPKDLILSIEVPNQHYIRTISPLERAQTALSKAREVFE